MIIGAVWVMTIAVSAVVLDAGAAVVGEAPGPLHPPAAALTACSWIVHALGHLRRRPARATPSRARDAGPARRPSVRGDARITVGDASDGSPILWQDLFTATARWINALYPLGTDVRHRRGHDADALKQPEVLDWMRRFSRYVERQLEIGGVSLADIVAEIRRNSVMRATCAYRELGADAGENGELVSFTWWGR